LPALTDNTLGGAPQGGILLRVDVEGLGRALLDIFKSEGKKALNILPKLEVAPDVVEASEAARISLGATNTDN